MFEFFYAPGTCALASHIALEEAGAPHKLHRLNFANQDQTSAEYLAVNSKGRVPTLVTPAGALTETPAILAYIAQAFPDAGLAPLNDPFAFARIQSFNSYLCSTVHVSHAHRVRGYRWTDDPAAIETMKMKVPETVAAGFAHIENELFIGPYVMGEHYSIADPYLFTLAQWMPGDSIDPARFPKIAEHGELMRSRPAVARALEAEKV